MASEGGMKMSVNNIFNCKISNMFTTARIQVGNSLQLAPENRSKTLGGASTIGDGGVNVSGASNVSIDPDLIDQVYAWI